jgi:hypothetical protein
MTRGMPKLSDLVRTLTPANYRFTSNVVHAVAVQGFMLEDNVVDFSRLKQPIHKEALENDLLQRNDVVIGFKAFDIGNEREIDSAAIYHPQLPYPEPVTLASRTMAFRASNLSEATSILAALIYRLGRRRELTFREIRAMEITPLTDDQIPKFLDLIKVTHEMRVNMRKRDALMKELIPATVGKFYNDNKQPEEIKL